MTAIITDQLTATNQNLQQIISTYAQQTALNEAARVQMLQEAANTNTALQGQVDGYIAASQSRLPLFNLLPDMGRFTSAGWIDNDAAFVMPSMLALYNGATAVKSGQKLHNGDSASQPDIVKALVAKSGAHPSYGSTYCVARITAGATTLSPNPNAQTTYSSLLINYKTPWGVSSTTMMWLRVISGAVSFYQSANLPVYIDGALRTDLTKMHTAADNTIHVAQVLSSGGELDYAGQYLVFAQPNTVYEICLPVVALGQLYGILHGTPVPNINSYS